MGIKSVSKARKRFSFIVLLVACVLWVLPIVWGFSTSFKTPQDISANPISLIPEKITFAHYLELFSKPDTPIMNWMLNSFIIAVTHTLLYLVVASFAAYAFGVLRFKGRDKIFWLILSTSMIPVVINLVPLISMMIDFNWFGTWLALIIPGLGGVFGMFLLRQFFLGIPRELIEAAKIDGLGNFGIFLRIVLPLSKSALLVTGLFSFMGSWNDYLWPQVVLMSTDAKNLTLPVGLAKISGTYNYDYGLTMAAAIISIIPVIIVYAFTQDKIIEGVSRTGIK